MGWFGPPPAFPSGTRCRCGCHHPPGEVRGITMLTDPVAAASACEMCRHLHPDAFTGTRDRELKKPWEDDGA